MNSRKYSLHFLLVFLLGLCTGFLLRNPAQEGIYLNASQKKAPGAFKEADFPLPTVGLIIEREGYSICYDARGKNPYYVVEVLTAESLKGSADRAEAFREDEEVPQHLRATLQDYKGSGLDRGHMAPAADHKKSVQHMANTFFLTNICPQNPSLNRNYWAKFEGRVRDLTRSYKAVQVITGPLYLPQGKPGARLVQYKCIGPNDVAVPTHFFKVLLLEQERGAIEKRAYIMPNEHIAPETPLESFQVTIQKVEQVSGILFPR